MNFFLCLLLLLVSSILFAQPLSSTSITHSIPAAEKKYQIQNFKMVMPGVLYRGGSFGERAPLKNATLVALCQDGFKSVVYVYSKDWHSNKQRLVKCSNNEVHYAMKLWNRPKKVNEILQELHNIIVNRKGAMYVHCWYGMHASGYVATVALMQFCNFSPDQGVVYWNSNVPPKLQYSKVQTMIRNFKRDPNLQLTAAQRSRVCPH